MNYGHTGNIVGNPAASSAESFPSVPNTTTDNPADNLNSENWNSAPHHAEAESLPDAAKTENFSGLGQSALNANRPPEALGEIVPVEPTNAQTTDRETIFHPENIRTSGDSLEKSSIVEIDNAISALSQTGDLNTFYNEIRSMTEANLSNSYNRKLAS